MAMMATAAALCASATTIELLKNGEGTTLDGWVNTDSRPSASVTNQTTEGGISWFASSFRQCQLSQTVTLLERGLTKGDIQGKPTVTASGIVWAGQNNGSNSGNNICNV
ncbi:MAG: hypothetical protein IJG13_19540, partial [Kiritimatiellae bacterium]|nr:hypothetical protein [Kiritimatiellia bacterium]